MADVDLHHEERGQGPPIVCIHGAGTYSETWWPAMEPLVESHRVVVYDRRGYGRSGGDLAPNLDTHVDDAADLIESLDADPATVVGMSAAGPICFALAARHPALVERLIVAEPAFQMLLAPSLSTNAAFSAMQIRRVLRRPVEAATGFYRWTSARTSGGNGYDPLPEAWKRTAEKHGAAVFRELAQLLRPWPSAREMRSISCPVTLVIADDGQPVFRRTTERAARLLPAARRVEIEDAGHLIPTDQPAAFGSEVAAAIRA